MQKEQIVNSLAELKGDDPDPGLLDRFKEEMLPRLTELYEAAGRLGNCSFGDAGQGLTTGKAFSQLHHALSHAKVELKRLDHFDQD